MRELLAQPQSMAHKKFFKHLWSMACTPDNNLGVADVGPSPQKQSFVRVDVRVFCTSDTMQSSAASVLIAMGVDKDSHFLDIGAV